MSDNYQDNYITNGTIIEHLKETFLKYLNPKCIIEAFISAGKINESDFQIDGNQEVLFEAFLDWLLEEDESAEKIDYFTSVVKKLSENSALLLTGNIRDEKDQETLVQNYLPELITLIDGSLIRKLDRTDLSYILDQLIKQKFITEQSRKYFNKVHSDSEFCSEILRSLKARKPDWPFCLINIIKERKPETFDELSQGKFLKSINHQPEKTNEPSPVDAADLAMTASNNSSTNSRSFSNESAMYSFNLTKASSSSNNNENASADITSTTQSNSDFKIPAPNIEAEEYKPQKFSGPASVALSDCSSLSECSQDYCETVSYASEKQSKRQMTFEERNSPDFKALLNKKVIDKKFIDDKKDNEAESQDLNAKSHHSDSEDDSDENCDRDLKKIKLMEDGPPLNLRNYQVELAEKAVQGLNAVICAPTGSGKTRVATHIILEHLKQNKKKTIAFLTRTIPLTIQQYKVLKNSLPAKYHITYITGQSQDSLELKTFVKKNDIVVLTPMILVNHLRNKTVLLRNFSMLIFDECHHTRKEEPYNLLMFMYLKAKLKGNDKTRSNLPQIVGLSASIGIDKAKNKEEAAQNILKICGNLDAPHLCTVQKNKEELTKLVPVPKEFDIQLKERDSNDALNKVINVMNKLETYAQKAAADSNDPSITSLIEKMPRNRKSQEYGKWAVDVKSAAREMPILDLSRETMEPVRNLMIIADYLWSYNVALETHDLVELRDVMGYLNKRFEKFRLKDRRTDKEEIFYTFFEDLVELVKRRNEEDNQNLDTLAKLLLTEIVKKGKDSKGIIFVRTKALAEALSSWLKRCGIKDIENLNASIFTGTNAKEEEGGMSQAQQEDTIKEFREGKIKILVATSVAEEGLDIPDCNLVVKYNHVGNEITTVQTRGRSRKKGGVAYLLGMDNILRREYVNRGKEKLMKKGFMEIHEMSLKEKEDFIQKYQTELIQEAEIEEALMSKRKKQFKDVEFTMVCSLCRKVMVKRENIRVIFDKFRVSVDRNLLDEKFVKCVPMPSLFRDEMEFFGPVFCRGEPKPGKICGHKLGNMIKYGGVHYFAMGIRKFGFYLNNQEKLEHYKMWKSVPYVVENLSSEDIKKYNNISPEDLPVYEDDEDSSDDEDYKNETNFSSENNPGNLTESLDETLGDDKNSVSHDDIQQIRQNSVSAASGSLIDKTEQILKRAPSLSSDMKSELMYHKPPSIPPPSFSDLGSDD